MLEDRRTKERLHYDFGQWIGQIEHDPQHELGSIRIGDEIPTGSIQDA